MDLYHEVHVIVSDRPNPTPSGWWASLVGADEGEEKSGDWILTTRRPTRDEAVRAIVDVASDVPFTMKRYKIETVTLDSKVADELGFFA